MRNEISLSVWVSELAKACVWFVGIIIVLVLMLLLAPNEAKADSISVSNVASFLDQNSPIPIAVGIDSQLANNLIQAQRNTWGKTWYPDSLELSEESVLRAIGLYDVSLITRSCCDGVWVQSNIAIDPRLTVTFTPSAIDFGEKLVSTPEPEILALLLLGLGLVLSWRTWRHA